MFRFIAIHCQTRLHGKKRKLISDNDNFIDAERHRIQVYMAWHECRASGWSAF